MSFALVGNICVGKSTLSAAIDDEYRRRHIKSIVVKEKRDEGVMSYYSSGLKNGYSENAFEVEMRTLADRCMDHKKAVATNADRIIYDRWLWCNRVFAGVSIETKEERSVFETVFRTMMDKIELPKLVFYLRTLPTILFEENQIRSLRDSRESERGLPELYFKLIDSSYENEMKHLKKEYPEIKIVLVDWSEYGSAKQICDLAEHFFSTGELKLTEKMSIY